MARPTDPRGKLIRKPAVLFPDQVDAIARIAEGRNFLAEKESGRGPSEAVILREIVDLGLRAYKQGERPNTARPATGG